MSPGKILKGWNVPGALAKAIMSGGGVPTYTYVKIRLYSPGGVK